MKFTDGIIGIEEFAAISSMCCEEMGRRLLRALDLGEVGE